VGRTLPGLAGLLYRWHLLLHIVHTHIGPRRTFGKSHQIHTLVERTGCEMQLWNKLKSI